MTGSMFDGYEAQIQEYLDAGLSFQMIADILGKEIFNPSKDNLYAFCRSRGIKSDTAKLKSKKERYIHLPICDECENCRKVRSVDGYRDIRICEKENRVVGGNVVRCPEWCPSREINQQDVRELYKELMEK